MAIKQKTQSNYLIVIYVAICLPMIYSFIKFQTRIDDAYLKSVQSSISQGNTKEDAEKNADLLYNKPNLVGVVINNEKIKFSLSTWMDGSYQSVMDDYLNDHWSFKELMVRVNNQFYYKAFNQIRVNGFIIGKDDYVFSEGYIFSAFGDDLLKEVKVKNTLKKAKILQDTLKKKGIDLLLVFAPGKGAYCKEFVEKKYVHKVNLTNHNLFTTYSKKYALNYLDLYTYFEKLKKTTPYPLFPKFGHHWSYYAECLAVDTIIKKIQNLHHCDLPDLFWKKIEVVDSARGRDDDVLKSMNLFYPPKQNMKLAYPEIQFEDDSLKNTTRVLTISDSYWYGPVYMGVGQACFAGGQFWYYCNKVVPSPKQGEKVEVWELDFKKEIESNQIIMILYSDGNLSLFGNNFIEDAYELYTSPKTYYERTEKNKKIQIFTKQIRETPFLLKKSTQKSNDLQIGLDSAIKIDAMKMLGLLK